LPKVPGEPCRWYQFNDTLVDPFDPEEIPKTCFGGADTVSEWDDVAGKHLPKWRTKSYSAYMLFYQRIQVTSPIAPSVYDLLTILLIFKKANQSVARD